MRNTLLISVAAIALTAASFASAQTQNRGPAGPSAAPAAPSMNAAPSQGATEATPSATEHAPGVQKGAKGTPDQSGPQKQQQKTTQQPTQPNKGTAQTEQEQKNQPRSSQSDTKQPTPGAAQNNQAAPSNTQNNTRGTTQNNAPGATPGTTQNNQATGDRPMTSRSVSLTTEQKTVIRTKVLTSSAPRVETVNFDIRVGVVVPRTVRVVPLPVEIIEIQPTWRGYLYFVRGDEIIVVEPGTLRIVAVLEV